MESTTTTTTSTSSSNDNKPPSQQPQQQKPKNDKPRQPKQQQPKAAQENGSTEGTVKPPPKPQQQRNSKPKANNNNNNNSNTTTTTSSSPNESGNGEKKQQRGGGGHNHHHHHHHNNKDNKKQTTTTTTTTTSTNNKPHHNHHHHHHHQQPQQQKALEFVKDKSFNTLLDIKRFETSTPITDQCIICCDPIIFYGKGTCDHIEVCSHCLLRQRELYKDFKCCICKNESKTIIITKDKEKKYEEYDKSKLAFNSKLNIYCTDAEFEKSLARLWEPICQVCNQQFPTIKKLELHLTTEHALMFCQICLADRKVFLAEQNLYDPKKLPIHMAEWDGGAGITIAGKKKGHPACKFCNKYYYGNDQLYEHLNKNHFLCFVCESKGLLYQYFSDFPKIRHHFNDEHYPCMHPECLEKKFIVFPDEYSLKSHEISTHLDTSRMSKGQRRNATQVNIAFERSSSSNSNNNNNGPSIPSADAFNTNLSGQQVQQPRTTTTTTTNTHNHHHHQQQSQQPQRISTTSNLLNAPAPSTFNPDFHKEKKEEKEITQSELDERNKKLVVKIQQILNNEKKYASFKSLSVDFKNGKLEPNAYYTKFLGLFGTQANDIFDELIALLPDRSKREALSQIHSYMKVVEDQYPSLSGAISKKSNKSNSNGNTSNIWSTGSSTSLSIVKNRPSDGILSYPGYLNNRQTTTTTTTSSNNNTAASKINNRNNDNSATSMAYRLTSSRYIPRTGDSDSDDDEDDHHSSAFPTLGGDRYTSSNSFSKIQVESSNNKPTLASTLSKVNITPTTSSSSTVPSSLRINKIPTNNKDDFPSLPGSENFVPKKKVTPKEQPKQEETIIKKGGKQKQVLLRFG